MAPEFLCVLGLLAHQMMILAEMSQASGQVIWPQDYIRKRPYKFGLSIIGTIVGYAALMDSGQITSLTAFGVGVVANDIIDRIGKITAAKIQ